MDLTAGNENSSDRSTEGTRRAESTGMKPAPIEALTPRGSIELHIDQVVLHGFAAADRGGIAQAMETELARLLGEEGIPAALETGYALESLSAGELRVYEGEAAERVGIRIARRIYQGLGR